MYLRSFLLWFFGIFLPCLANGDILISPNQRITIETNCANSRICSTVIKNSGKIYKALDSIDEPNIEWILPSVAKISYRCGSPCQIEQYFSELNGLSEPISDPIASSFESNCAVSATDKYIVIKQLYGNRAKTVKYNELKISPFRSAAMVSVFLEDRSLIRPDGSVILYYQDENNKVVSAVMTAACKKVNK